MSNNPTLHEAAGARSGSLVEHFKDRHPGTLHLLKFFEDFDRGPQLVRQINHSFHMTAGNLVSVLEDGPELTAGLRKLLEAKNCFGRQAFEQDHEIKDALFEGV